MNLNVRDLLPLLSPTAARYRSWVILGAATAIALLVAGAVRKVSIERAMEWENRRAELVRETEAAKAWLAAFQPPTPAESAAWRRSAAELASFSESNPDKLLAARLVAERAQAAGVRVERLSFLSPDSLEEAVPPAPEGAGISVAGWVLSVEAKGGAAELARFLANLPPGVALWQLQIVRDGTRGRAAARLLKYTASVRPVVEVEARSGAQPR